MMVSDWADKYRYLSSASSSEPGPWQTSRTPYLREIMDCMSVNPPYNRIRKISIMKGHQIGYTEGVLMNFIGYTISHHPGPTMLVAPSEKQVKKMLHQKIEPMINDSPVVKKNISTWSRASARNTQVHKDFPGGFLVLSGATIASDLAGTSVRNLLMDEVDRMTLDTEGEGSPVELAVGRTAAYSRRKIIMGSTPIDEESSVINRWFQEGDQRYYYLPCPKCGHKQHLVIENLIEQDGVVVYICEKCKHPIEEKYKTKMLDAGEWIPHNEDAPDNHRSYHLNSLYSPIGFLSWDDVHLAKERANNDEYYAQTFKNLYLGLPTKVTVGEVPVPSILEKRVKVYERGHNPQCRFITCGVDVQKDRLEALVVGWDRRTPYVIEHYVFWGETMSEESPWDELISLMSESFNGVKISLMGVDCGYIPHRVFSWKKKHRNRHVKIVRGSGTVGPIISMLKIMEVSESNIRTKTGNNYHEVNTDFLKDEIYSRLVIEEETHEEFVHLPNGLETEFYAQLCSERKVLKETVDPMDRSRTHQYKWKAIRRRNEALDLMVYAFSMWYLSGAPKRVNHWQEFCNRRAHLIHAV